MRALIVLIAVSWFIQYQAVAQTKYSILQGSTSDTVTHFTVVAPIDDNLRFEAISKKGRVPQPAAKVERITHEGSQWAVYRLRFQDLDSADDYVLRTLDRTNHVVDQRDFKTLSASARTGRIALVSCMLRQFHNPFMWNNLARPENRPDLILLLGDAVYLDRTKLLFAKLPTGELGVWEDFVKSRNKLNLYFWKNLVPTLSVWDDHDSGGDNVTAKSFTLMAKLRLVYDTFFANDEIQGSVNLGPGLSKQFEAFGRNFVMLDGRTFRELDSESPLFGKEQEDWMMEKLKPGANFIVSGSQFYGGKLRKDSLEYNWPEHSKLFTGRLRQAGESLGASFAFISGDVHFSQTQHLEEDLFGYETVEITSSSAHSITFPGFHIFNPSNPRQTSVSSTHNVVLMELDRPQQPFDFKIRALSWRNKTLFTENISVGGPCEQWLLSRKAP